MFTIYDVKKEVKEQLALRKMSKEFKNQVMTDTYGKHATKLKHLETVIGVVSYMVALDGIINKRGFIKPTANIILMGTALVTISHVARIDK